METKQSITVVSSTPAECPWIVDNISYLRELTLPTDFGLGPGRFCEYLAKWLAYHDFKERARVEVSLFKTWRNSKVAVQAKVQNAGIVYWYLIDLDAAQASACFSCPELNYQKWLFEEGEHVRSVCSETPIPDDHAVFSR